jgi:hypothetical protein
VLQLAVERADFDRLMAFGADVWPVSPCWLDAA